MKVPPKRRSKEAEALESGGERERDSGQWLEGKMRAKKKKKFASDRQRDWQAFQCAPNMCWPAHNTATAHNLATPLLLSHLLLER